MQIANRRILSLFRSELRRLESTIADVDSKDGKLSTCFETNEHSHDGDRNSKSEDKKDDLHELFEDEQSA